MMHMNERPDLPNVLQESWECLEPGRPPISEMITTGRRLRRRRVVATSVGLMGGWVAAMIVLVPILLPTTDGDDPPTATSPRLEVGIEVQDEPATPPFATWSASAEQLVVTLLGFSPTCLPTGTAQVDQQSVTITLEDSLEHLPPDVLCSTARARVRIVVDGLGDQPRSVIVRNDGSMNPTSSKMFDVAERP